MDVEKDIDYLAVEKMSKLRADSIEYLEAALKQER